MLRVSHHAHECYVIAESGRLVEDVVFNHEVRVNEDL